MQNVPPNEKAPEPRKTEDARRPMRPPGFAANYGPSASYTPATDSASSKVPAAKKDGE